MYMPDFHPGRRKRRIIMHERAFAVAFGYDPDKRDEQFPKALRELLEAIVDVHFAYEGKANKDRCFAAGEIALERSLTVASQKVSELERMGLISFENHSDGARLTIPEKTNEGLKELEKFARMIDVTSRIEERGMPICEKTSADIQALKDKNIYVVESNAELDEKMRLVVDEIVEPRLELRKIKQAERRERMAAQQTLKKAASLVVAGLISLWSYTTDLQASMADRGGTVGLTHVQSQFE